jgi:3-hydroxybutyryl-CoA dehydrogenase
MATIDKNLDRSVDKGKIHGRGQGARSWAASRPAPILNDMAGPTSWWKRPPKTRPQVQIFKDLDAICRPDTILATNTSSIPIGRIAAQTGRPDKVIGMHFMNPVPVMKLVEVIRGLATSDETFQTTWDLSEIRQDPGLANDSPALSPTAS